MIEIEICTVKNVPICKVQIETTWTVEDIKKAVANASPKLNVNRQSLREEAKGKDMRNDMVVSSLRLNTGSRLYVKDLGPQISWSAVFIAEYFGPLLVYGLFSYRPTLIYGDNPGVLSFNAYIAWICWTVHYAKRLLETIFVHRFSHGTMPLRNLFKNCSYYWGFAAFVAYHVNHPLYTPPPIVQGMLGLGMFIFCEIGNLSIHLLLRNLRPPGTSVRRIPVPNKNPFTALFYFVSCPNYSYEFGAWAGFTIMTSCIPSGLFALAGMFQMTMWALGKHNNYKKEFADYPRNRKAIIPFII